MDTTKIRRIYLVGFLVILSMLLYYQVIKGDYFANKALKNYLKVIPLESIRGKIFDRNGIVLAEDKPSFNIAVIPYQVKLKKEIIFAEIAKFTKLDEEILHKNYRKNFVNMFTPVDILIDIDKKTAIQIYSRFSEAVIINPRPKRYYFYPYETAHILGYVKNADIFFEESKKYGYQSIPRVGVSGIEKFYDEDLAGESGGRLIEVDSSGRIVGFLGEQRPTKGKDIVLTIDVRMQKIAYEALGQNSGVVILMDAKSGEILTLVSTPSFDPNAFIDGKAAKKFLDSLDTPLINRAIQANYPLGSTFKPIVAVAALEENLITQNTTYVCEQKITVGDRDFRCLARHGQQNLLQAMMHSCNIYFYNLGLKLGPERMIRYAKKFNLDSLTGIDLPFEKRGILPETFLKNWFAGDTANLAIGQGRLAISPLAVLVAINAIGNNGYLVRPHILRQVDSLPVKTHHIQNVGISEKSLSMVKQSLIDVVEKKEGTANLLSGLNLKIAGKTGTAQTKTKPHGWFVGFFPYTDPKYAICVFLENVGSSYEAVKTAYEFLTRLVNEKIILSG